MKNKLKEFIGKFISETKKYSFIKRTRVSAAVTMSVFITAEMLLTGMTTAHKVTIYVDGQVIETTASGITLGEVLGTEGVMLSDNDEISLPLDTVVNYDMRVFVDRIVYIETEKVTPIEYDTVYEESSLYEMGNEFVSTQGEQGSVTTTYYEKLVNGEVVSSVVKGTTTINPVNEVITVGTALSEPYSKRIGDFDLENGVPTDYAYVVSGKVTAYTAPEGAGTYSGRTLGVGTVAVNPNIIPFGSELYICSKDGSHVYGYAIAADTGDLTEVVADVFMGVTSEHYGDACRWGAQFCDVYVLTVGDNSVSWM